MAWPGRALTTPSMMVDTVGSTPLLHAVSVDFGDTRMVQLLLASGARLDVRSKANESPRELAERYGHAGFVKLLAHNRF